MKNIGSNNYAFTLNHYDYDRKKQFAYEIQQLRNNMQIKESLEKCREASGAFPNDSFFYRIEGDLYLQIGRPEDAAESYLKSLRLLRGDMFHVFQKSYNKLKKAVSDEFIQSYRKRVLDMMEKGEAAPEIAESLRTFFTSAESSGQRFIRSLSQKIAEDKEDEIPLLIAPVLSGDISFPNLAECKSIIRSLEKRECYRLALELLKKTPPEFSNKYMAAASQYFDKYIVAAALRLCRKADDYSDINTIIKIDDRFIDKSDFNIQYELAWYFKTSRDGRLNKVLDKMAVSARQSLPIAKTLYNFYLSLNRMDDAQKLSPKIQQLTERQISNRYRKSASLLKSQEERTRLKAQMKTQLETQRKRLEPESESDEMVRDTIQELVSEKEQSRRMLAMSNLLKGFSHELGQPMTNIRLNIQLYQMKTQKQKTTPEDLSRLFDLILSQTRRLDYLLKRLNPITSSKSRLEWFGLGECITHVIDDLSSRLTQAGISCELRGNTQIQLWGDSVQFSQVFYNLFLNSMQAMQNKEKGGHIWIDVSESVQHGATITVADDGPGIPEEYQQKVFEPFFTTKQPSSDNGGEGLGLYIVWNVLQMFRGSIEIDKEYRNGVKFIIHIQPQKGDAL